LVETLRLTLVAGTIGRASGHSTHLAMDLH